MILIITNQEDYTADFLILALKHRGLDFLRFNTEEFPQQVELNIEFIEGRIAGTIRIREHTINLLAIQSIWYRRPIPSVIADSITDQAAREFAQGECKEVLDGLWRVLPAFWVSHPDRLRVAESKILQLAEAARLGFVIPHTLITTVPQAAVDFYTHRSGVLIYKPLRYGHVTRQDYRSLIFTNLITEQHAAHLENVQYAPAVLQPYIAKKTELRATVVGNQVLTAEIHSQEVAEASHDWRRVDATTLRHTPYTLPTSVAEKCIALTHRLGLAFGAIDLILTPDGQYVFLEINPNGQWAWIEQVCPELRISDALIDLLAREEM